MNANIEYLKSQLLDLQNDIIDTETFVAVICIAFDLDYNKSIENEEVTDYFKKELSQFVDNQTV